MHATRLPSVLATGTAVAGMALLGRRLAGPRAGLFAGVVFALEPSVQFFAQEGRSDPMVCALVVWATYVLVRGGAGRRPLLWAVGDPVGAPEDPADIAAVKSAVPRAHSRNAGLGVWDEPR